MVNHLRSVTDATEHSESYMGLSIVVYFMSGMFLISLKSKCSKMLVGRIR